MMTEIRYREKTGFWEGRRDDGLWFMMKTEQGLRSCDWCDCSMDARCPRHMQGEVPIIWRDVRKI